MDVDAYASAHGADWQRLEILLGRRHLSGPEADELVRLYQRTATHLSTLRSASPDPVLVARLSTLVARARAAITGSHNPAWRDVARFLTVTLPAGLYQTWRWWTGVAAAVLLVCWAVAVWVAGDPRVQASIATPDEVRQLVAQDFEAYYSSHPATSFAAYVWTHNAWIAAVCLVSGILIVPVLWILLVNAVNIGVVAGLMASAGRLDLFFGLITPHGLLELTAVFVAAGAGLKLGWTLIDPGERLRGQAIAAQGRVTVGIALGVALVLAVSGVIEAFVTPSGLPTWARIAIGVAAFGVFLSYVVLLGSRAVRAGETGDVSAAAAGDQLPAAA